MSQPFNQHFSTFLASHKEQLDKNVLTVDAKDPNAAAKAGAFYLNR